MLISHLHSTMYLFQRKTTAIATAINRFTFHYVSISTVHFLPFPRALEYLHSTMYLFQHFSKSPFIFPAVHLHSTMYLFQQPRRLLFKAFSAIYIPLCIYFNLYSEQEHRESREHLHSTMYLFQQ